MNLKLPEDIYSEAELLRKAGRYGEAEMKYWSSINSGKNDPMWRQYGPATAMFEALAKLYYRQNLDEKALGILDLYLQLSNEFGRSHHSGKIESRIRQLYQKMKTGEYRRVRLPGPGKNNA